MKVDWFLNRWLGKTVVCAASGPSLVSEDLATVRAAGLPLIVCNDTWSMAPWADAMAAMDTSWWKEKGAAAVAGFSGLRACSVLTSMKFGAQYCCAAHMVQPFGNTGAMAIALAIRSGAARVLLLGYDCRPGPSGELHWHPDHPAPLKNATTMFRWPAQFADVARHAEKRGCKIINCSRVTNLLVFKRRKLGDMLADRGHLAVA